MIVFDGPDGSGKSTQFRRFAEYCRSAGLDIEEVREPGGTAVGERIRGILLDPIHNEMTLRAEMLLYMASRAQLVEERIEPALKRGAFVLADRFVSSTLAYQGSAGGLDTAAIEAVARVALAGRNPKLVVIFDVDTDTAMSRLPPQLDRMEGKGVQFHRKVRDGYLEQASRHPDSHLVIDASGGPDEVFAALISGLRARLTA
ncbi:MAG: dTMP kinase [Phycisphaerales bacterium]|nr:dTMP kinase [Phycisphaerales bacterium]